MIRWKSKEAPAAYQVWAPVGEMQPGRMNKIYRKDGSFKRAFIRWVDHKIHSGDAPDGSDQPWQIGHIRDYRGMGPNDYDEGDWNAAFGMEIASARSPWH